MPYTDLQDFIATLERAGELKQIKAEVDPELEITEIASRVMKTGGPCLLFERVKESQYPLVINAFGSEKRVALALGAKSLDEKAAEIEGLVNWAWGAARNFSLLKTLPEAIPKLPIALSLIPRKVSRLLCKKLSGVKKIYADRPPPCGVIA